MNEQNYQGNQHFFPAKPQRPKPSMVPVWIGLAVGVPFIVLFMTCAGCLAITGQVFERSEEQIEAAKAEKQRALEYDRTRPRADDETQATRLAKLQEFQRLGLIIRGPVDVGKTTSLYIDARLWTELDMFSKQAIRKLALYRVAEAVDGWKDGTGDYVLRIYDARNGDRIETYFSNML